MQLFEREKITTAHKKTIFNTINYSIRTAESKTTEMTAPAVRVSVCASTGSNPSPTPLRPSEASLPADSS